MTYPNTPGFAKWSDTSKEAADLLTDKPQIWYCILNAIKSSNNHGLTVDEVKPMVQWLMQRDFDRSTIAARFTEMKELGYLEETDERRPTPRGRSATVFKITIKGRDYLLNH